MKRNSIVLSVALVLVTGYVAQAVTVTNVTNSNTVVFYDNFEGVSPVSTVPAIDNSGDFDPVAVTGAWTPAENGGQAIIQVTSSTTSPDPGPFEGQQYLRIYRDGTLNDHDPNGVLTAPQTNNGDIVRLNMMVYVPNDGENVRGQMMLLGTASDVFTARAWFRPDGAGNVIAVEGDGAGGNLAVVDTGLDYTPGVWQEWALEYVIGASTFSVSVAGASASGFDSVLAGGTTGISSVFLINGSNTAGSVYFDAVPEPSSVALLMFGGIGLFAAKRRRRK